MAKFAVGEPCEAKGRITGIWSRGIIDMLPHKHFAFGIDPETGWDKQDAYVVRMLDINMLVLVMETHLRKLPPHGGTTEDPGLTRIKKLLKHETAPHKKPITTPETTS